MGLLTEGRWAQPRRARLGALLLAALLLPASQGKANLATDNAIEYQAKAAFVSNVMKFVEWPESSLAPDHGPMIVVVVGGSSARVVADTLAGVSWKGRPLLVTTVDRAVDLPPCQVLFVTAEAGGEGSEALRAVRGQAVLTITEADQPAQAVVRLMVIDTRLRFDIDLAAAMAGQLRVNANLLALARRVSGQHTSKGLL